MTPFDKPLESVTESDLTGLVEAAVPEGQHIDYKRETIGGKDNHRYDFAADVSSFANSTGGWMVLGLDEDAGKASEIVGLPGVNVDREIVRLTQILSSGIDPRVPGVHMRGVETEAGECLVIRVPRSFAKPHQVTLQSQFRFYVRRGPTKIQMTRSELREQFVEFSDLVPRAERFRLDRIASIADGDGPVPLHQCPRFTLHFVPVASLGGQPLIESPLPQPVYDAFGQIYRYGTCRYLIDGVVSHRTEPEYGTSDYCFMNWAGRIEWSHEISPWKPERSKHDLLPSITAEEWIIDTWALSKHTFQVAGIEPPVLLMATMTGIAGRALGVSDPWGRSSVATFSKNLLLSPVVMLESFAEEADRDVRRLVDSLWNAAGYGSSAHYDNDGRWAPRR